ncbi:MAG: glycosyltransferase family 39 protein [Bacteroidetes bacterium]|nr:glycosyltransferase family 39 protein [Bacteroidota bacterium]
MKFRKPKIEFAMVMLLLITISFYFYHDIIHLFPTAIHSWTQSDRLALALGFLNNGFNFFKPQMFNLMTVDGITGVDFPIHEYFIAVLMKIFGTQNPAIFRIYILGFSLIGYYFLFRFTKAFTNSTFKASMAVLFVFTCPVITYYQAGFIPSATAFSSALIGYYYYFKFKQTTEIKLFYASIAFLALAALARTPYNIFLFAVLLQQLLAYLKNRALPAKEVLAFSMAYASIIGYNIFKIYLGKTYGSQFLTTFLPPENFSHLKEIILTVKENWAFHYFTVYHYALLGIAAVAIIAYFYKNKGFEKPSKEILIQAILIISGACIYFLLMARQFQNHDYYFMDSFYLGLILIFIAGLKLLALDTLLKKTAFGTLLVILISGSFIKSKETQTSRYIYDPLNRVEITRKNLTGSDVFLDSLGIPANAKILLIDAYSSNAPLILMNRKGHTIIDTRKENLIDALNLSYDYVVMQDMFIPSDVVLNYPEIVFMLKRLGGNGKISVFSRTDINLENTLFTMLGIKNETIISAVDFEQSTTNNESWKNINVTSTEFSLSRSQSGFVNAQTEFGPMFEVKLNEQINFNKLLFEGYFYRKGPQPELIITTSVQKEADFKYYWNFPVIMDTSNHWVKYQCLFDLPENTELDNVLKCYLWNPDGTEIYFKDLKVILYKN